MNFKNIIVNNQELTYRNSDIKVEVPESYIKKDSYFRAAWVSYIVNDFEPSPDKETMKKNLLEVLGYLEYMNMNAIIFHVRTHNNAYYKTKRAPILPKFGTYESFEEWDYLTWFIDECHSRGIEFHAWMNPYRIKTAGYPAGTTADDVAKMYENYPVNPAHDKNNIIMSYDGGAILNPCKDNVQEYIIDTCLEFLENYNADAIHFDDYFYVKMTEKNEILIEADQINFENHIRRTPNCPYKPDSFEDKQQWRRDNVDKFIYDLSCAIKKFNKENNREVQLGISPTGIYANGDGKVTYDEKGRAITTGSCTRGQEHYESYLYCDSKKWVEEEWIDYLIPQTYWGLSHPVAGYADVAGWWDKVFKYSKVNLYCGMGIYMNRHERGESWYSDPNEAYNEVLYASSLENVKGISVFSFKSMVSSIKDEAATPHNALEGIRKELWNDKVPTPKTLANK